MKLQIVHLSDIHLSEDQDPVSSRVAAIASAIRALPALPHDHCVLVLTGDIAHSGSEPEYSVATQFVASLQSELSGASETPTTVVVVPGNHDCDLAGHRLGAREAVIRDILSGGSVDESVVDLCTSVQSNFFDFAEVINSGESSRVGFKRLSGQVSVAAGNETGVFTWLNSAWMSKIREQRGQLAFPVERIPRADAGTLHVYCLHHPYAWLQNHREVRAKIEEHADIVLTGHEHERDEYEISGRNGSGSLYLEGGVLQERGDPGKSQFNVLQVDTSLKKQRLFSFTWGDGLYRSSSDDGWKDYHTNSLRESRRFAPSSTFLQWCDDPELSLYHPERGRLLLRDFYVEPDLREIDLQKPRRAQRIRASNVLDILRESRALLITGPERSGKTCLAKWLVRELRERGRLPLLVKGRALRSSAKVNRALRDAFQDQYPGSEWDRFAQLEPDQKFLIVDDCDEAEAAGKTIPKLLGEVTGVFGYVALLADDLGQEVADLFTPRPAMKPNGPSARMPHYRIQTFGHGRREELAQKWCSLGDVSDPVRVARRVADAKDAMDNVVGKNFVPSYPVFLLPMLQVTSANEPLDLNASTYGHYYEVLIKRDLAQASTHGEYSVKVAYLAKLGWKLVSEKKSEVSEAELRAFHEAYEAAFGLSLAYVPLVRTLTETGLLVSRGDEFYSFRYQYVRYYFAAKYLSEYLGEHLTALESLATQTSDDESANILLFLIHLSRDQRILEALLGAARRVFPESLAVGLRPEDSPVPMLGRVLDAAVYVEKPVADARREAMAQRDTDDEEEVDAANSAQIREMMRRLSGAFKTVQLLGQALKNSPGTLVKEDKERTIAAINAAGMRTLGWLYDLLRKNADELVRTLVGTIRASQPGIGAEDVLKTANASMRGLALVAGHGMIRRVIVSLASPQLMPMVREYFGRESGEAADRLIGTGIHLESLDAFPVEEVTGLARDLSDAKNWLAADVLSLLVLNHFHLFHVRFDLKQTVCEKLGIEYRGLEGRSGSKLLPSGRPVK